MLLEQCKNKEIVLLDFFVKLYRTFSSVGTSSISSNSTWNLLTLKKKAQPESCKLSFIWSKMRTASQETALQIALRKCSKEVRNRSVCMKFWRRENTCNQVCIFPEGFWQSGEAFCQSQGTVITVKDFSAFLNLGRYKNWAHEICSR